jgi:hypothetical protein
LRCEGFGVAGGIQFPSAEHRMIFYITSSRPCTRELHTIEVSDENAISQFITVITLSPQRNAQLPPLHIESMEFSNFRIEKAHKAV